MEEKKHGVVLEYLRNFYSTTKLKYDNNKKPNEIKMKTELDG